MLCIHDTAQCQRQIIKLQTECIDKLFSLLSQHVTQEELEELDCLTAIQEISVMKKYLDMD